MLCQIWEDGQRHKIPRSPLFAVFVEHDSFSVFQRDKVGIIYMNHHSRDVKAYRDRKAILPYVERLARITN